MGNFQQFCDNISSPNPIKITHPDDMIIPDKYQMAVNSMIENMKPKTDIFDKISVPFVEAAFQDMNYVDEKLKSVDIPDGIMNTLASRIFNKKTDDCDRKEQSILKVLTVYIMLQ